jgi:peroxiredoxin Q/BCP
MAITVGKPAPEFALPSSDGTTQTLASLRGSLVVVYFYPRDNTPGCTIEAEAFRDALPALTKLGAKVFGVSKDSLASHGKFRDKFKLNFPLLTDADGAMLTAYGAWGEKVMYGKAMLGIIRSTVLIGADGRVLAHWPKVSVKGHAEAVLEAVRAARSGGGTAAAPAAPAKKAAPAAKQAAPAAKAPAKPAPKKPVAVQKPAPGAKKPAPAPKKPLNPVKKPAPKSPARGKGR